MVSLTFTIKKQKI